MVAGGEGEHPELTLPLGKAVRQGDVWTAEQTLSLEGAVTHLLYAAPAERTPLEVFRNSYESNLSLSRARAEAVVAALVS